MKLKPLFAAVAALLAVSALPAQGKSKTLVIYYSWSGNTQKIARIIQEKTGADIYEIVLEKPYPADYNACLDAAKSDQNRNARPAIKGKLPDVSPYGTVILAYPLWWGDVPMHFYTLLEKTDLSGKTVLPVCSNGGGGLARSVGTIKRLAPKATVKAGLSIYRDGGANLEETLSSYLKKNGMEKQMQIPTKRSARN